MANFTPRLNLRKPDPDPITGDDVDVQKDLNDNWDKIDGAIAAVDCTSGTRPTNAFKGQLARETDTGAVIICVNEGPPAQWRYLVTEGGTIPFTGVALQGSSASTNVFSTRVSGNANPQLDIRADGQLVWGGDTNLYRTTTNTLKTDDSFQIGGNLTVTNADPTFGGLTVPRLVKAVRVTNTGNPIFTTSGTTEHHLSHWQLTGLSLTTNRIYLYRALVTWTKSAANDTFEFRLRANNATSGTIISHNPVATGGGATIGWSTFDFLLNGSSSWTSLHLTVQRISGSGTMSIYGALSGSNVNRAWAMLIDYGTTNWSTAS